MSDQNKSVDIGEYLRAIEEVELQDESSTAKDARTSVPFHLVSAGVLGRVAVVPGSVLSPMHSSTTPFGGRELPSFSVLDRDYVKKECVDVGTHIHGEQESEPPLRWFQGVTWPRQGGPGLYTATMSQPRTSLVRRPVSDVKQFILSDQWEVVEEPIDATGEGYSVGTLDKPTAKLSQYSRGKTGAMKPFTPGGLDTTDRIGGSGNDALGRIAVKRAADAGSLCDSAIAASLVVLGDYTDDQLITAPPGIDPKYALTRDHVLARTTGENSLEKAKVADEPPHPPPSLKVSKVAGVSSDNGNTHTRALQRSSSGRQTKSLDSTPIASIDFTSLFDGSYSDDSDSEDETSSESESLGEEEDQKEHRGDRDTASLPPAPAPNVGVLNGAGEVVLDEEAELEALLGSSHEAGGLVGGGRSVSSHRAMMEHLLEQHSGEKKLQWAVSTSLDVSDFSALVPNPAITYPFELDGFQKQAIARLERRECVFVAAHTSAGKTVVAEYAIAMAARHMTRAIYTSPIKALSNQKYRDFKSRFGDDVGLITGDVSINPEASCLIMTTEILRSMLYRGADLIRDIEWVIFDEVHYINDSERGVVWEEVIIMLPEQINMIFLSATTPNTTEFSDWIGRTKKKPVHVITTEYRPVPLQHYIYAGNQMFKIMDHRKKFLPGGHAEATAKLAGKEDKSKPGRGGAAGGRTSGGARGGGRGGGGGGSGPKRDSPGSATQWRALVNMLQKEGLGPTVVFSFSKRKCEECADALRGVDLCDATEKAAVHSVCSQALRKLEAADARLPQVLRTQDLLKRGVGIHHGGMLPILKEVVEILFSKGVVKVLFATETFAMGVNMPARSVVFNGFRKHDGREFRDLLPGEYTQMAGRAGRRGLDKVGTVIIVAWSEPPVLPSLKTMLTGSATKLESQFRLKYNMILNLLRVEDMSVEDMIKRSFSEFATQRALSSHDIEKFLVRAKAALVKLDKKAGAEPCIRGEIPSIEDFFSLSDRGSHVLARMLAKAVAVGRGGKTLLGPGRVLLVNTRRLVHAPAIVIKGPTGSGEYGRAAGGLNISETPGAGNSTAEGDEVTSFGTFLVFILCPEGFIAPKPKDTDTADSKFGEVDQRKVAPKPVFDPFEDLSLRKLSRDRDDDGFGNAGNSVKSASALRGGMYGVSSGRTYAVLDIGLHDVVAVGKARESVSSEALLQRGDQSAISALIKTLVHAERKLLSDEHPEGCNFPTLDIVKDLKIADVSVVEAAREYRHISQDIFASKCAGCPKLQDQYLLQSKRAKLRAKIALVEHIHSNERLQLFPDFQQRLRVLQSQEYVDLDGTVQLKGRAACEVNTADELIATELVFENVLQELDPPEVAGVLSALVFQEKSEDKPVLTARLAAARDRVVDIARGLGALQARHGLPTSPDDFAKANLNFGVVDVVYDWARGVPFSEICQLTLVQEGTIVRTVTRLDELLREIRNVARVIGDPTLYRKMEATSLLIKRGVIFCGSLYL